MVYNTIYTNLIQTLQLITVWNIGTDTSSRVEYIDVYFLLTVRPSVPLSPGGNVQSSPGHDSTTTRNQSENEKVTYILFRSETRLRGP